MNILSELEQNLNLYMDRVGYGHGYKFGDGNGYGDKYEYILSPWDINSLTTIDYSHTKIPKYFKKE